MKILTRYLLKRFLTIFMTTLAGFTLLLGLQSLFISLRHLQEHSLSASNVLPFFLLEFLASFPFLVNFSMAISWILWWRSLEDEHEDFASLMTGWTASASRQIGYALLWATSLFNALTLFGLTPLLWHWCDAHLGRDLAEHVLLAAPPQVPLSLGHGYVFYFHDKGEGLSFTKPTLIATQKQHVLVMNAQQGRFDAASHTLSLIDGVIKNHALEAQDMHFKQLDVPIPMAHQTKTQEGLSITELLAQPAPLRHAELFWRLFLIFQPCLLILGFLNKKIQLRTRTPFERLILESVLLFAGSTILAVSVKNTLAKDHTLGLSALGLLALLLLGWIRNRAHEQ